MFRRYSSALTIRMRLLIAVWLVVTFMAALFSTLLYQVEKQAYMQGVDQKLITGATMARALLGLNYHDRLVDKDSVPMERYLSIVGTYNQICSKTGFQYLWSNLVLEDGTIVFTSGTSTSKNVEKGDHALFFDVHSDPAAFQPVLTNRTATFSTFHNEWGDGRMVLLPFEDAQGRTYVFGASISIEEFAQTIQDTAWRVILIFSGAFIVGTLLSVWIARTIANPVKKLDRIAREIAEGNYGHKVDDIRGGVELVSLATTVNLMSDEIKTNYDQLGHTVRELEETQDELTKSYEDLEDRVQQRTQDLRKLTTAIEQSPHMVIITDLDGNIEYVNGSFTAITGYTSDEIIGQNPRILQGGDTSKALYEDMWAGLLEAGIWTGELKDRRKNGQIFWASVVISVVKDEDGIPTNYVAIHEDITARKIAEKNIRLARDQAETASRAKSEMLANMSHELRTPLNAILGFSDSMLSETFGPMENDKYRDYVSDIHHSGRHLLELINDILDVAAIEAGKLTLHEEEVAVQDFIDPCLRLIKPRADAGQLALQSHVAKGLARVKVDARRMTQAVLNLLSNSVKFTPEGGQVTISAMMENDRVCIRVTDTGIGMSAKELKKALEEFGQVESSLSRKHDGTGLGLSLTQKLVELHGGQFVLTSRKGQGTQASIYLPMERVVK